VGNTGSLVPQTFNIHYAGPYAAWVPVLLGS